MTDQDKITALRDALQNMLEAYGEESGRTCVIQAHEALAMTADASEGATDDPLIARQVAIWRNEVARLQDLIASANGKPEGGAN